MPGSKITPEDGVFDCMQSFHVKVLGATDFLNGLGHILIHGFGPKQRLKKSLTHHNQFTNYCQTSKVKRKT